MPGRNSAGTPNTEDYNLGRGIVYFAPLSNSLPGAYRDLGNAPEFNISIEVETVEHQSSREGLRTVDKEVVISQSVSLSVTIDELNFENLALFFSGGANSHTNASVAGFVEHQMITSASQGRWYDIVDSNNNRAYDVDVTDLVVEVGATPAVEGTDYTLDATMGRIFVRTGSTVITEGSDVDVTLTANGSAADVDEVRALTQSAVTGALKFISVNPAASDAKTEYQFHQVSLSAEGDFSLIGDEFTTMQLNGVAERNATADADSPTLTVRYPKVA